MADAIGAQPLVCILGRLRVIGTDGITRTPTGTAERSLLVFLALHGGYVHTEQAITALWPDLPLSTGRTRLRNVLVRLRQSCGPIVGREGASLALYADTDLRRYQAALAILLEHAGQELAADERYAEWTDEVRRQLLQVQARLSRLL